MQLFFSKKLTALIIATSLYSTSTIQPMPRYSLAYNSTNEGCMLKNIIEYSSDLEIPQLINLLEINSDLLANDQIINILTPLVNIDCPENHPTRNHFRLLLPYVKKYFDNNDDINISPNFMNLLNALLGRCYKEKTKYPAISTQYIKMLLNLGAETSVTEKNGITALHYATGFGNFSLAKLLLERGVNVEIVQDVFVKILQAHFSPNRYGNQVLPYDITNPILPYDIIELLLEYGANASTPNKYGFTPLHQAVYYKDLSLAKLLLNHGANVNAKQDNLLRTPLHVATEYDSNNADPIVRYHLVELLLAYGAHVNVLDNGGISPLYRACQSNMPYIVILLLIKGADYQTKLYEGFSALDIAKSCKCDDIVDLIENHHQLKQETCLIS